MQERDALKKINETIDCLYQNKEKESLKKAAELLTYFKCMAETRAEKKDGSVLRVIDFLKDFIENYNCIDMIGMADCLQERAHDLVIAYGMDQ